jgi:hypothetical protein
MARADICMVVGDTNGFEGLNIIWITCTYLDFGKVPENIQKIIYHNI